MYLYILVDPLGCFLENIALQKVHQQGLVTFLTPFQGLEKAKEAVALAPEDPLNWETPGSQPTWEDEGLRNTRSFGVIFFVTKPRLRIISRRNGGNYLKRFGLAMKAMKAIKATNALKAMK